MPRILSTHTLHPRASAMLAGAGELVVASALDAATLTAEAKHADVIIVRAPLPPSLFENATKLRAAVRHGAGLDMVPMAAAAAARGGGAHVAGGHARSGGGYVVVAARGRR
ncbi:dehydrogenase, partial [Mesorhizobium sp. M0317]